MYKPLGLWMSNFLPFGQKEVHVDFNELGKLTNVVGLNLDVDHGDQDSSSNGVGKSSLFVAICYALFGVGIKKEVKQDEFINLVNGKKMYVKHTFEIDGVQYEIVRGRKPNVLTLKNISKDEDLTRDSTKNTNEAIERLIGMSYDTFVVTVLLSTTVDQVLSRKPAEQRQFFEQFLKMDKFSARAATAKKLRDEINTDIKVTERDLEHAESTLSSIQQELDRLKTAAKQFEENKAEELEELENAIREFGFSIEDKDLALEEAKRVENAEAEYVSAKEHRDAVERKLNKLELKLAKAKSDNSSIETDKKRTQEDIESTSEELRVAEDAFADLELQIPLYEEKADAHGEIASLKPKIEKLKAKQQTANDNAEDLRQKNQDLIAELDHLQKSQCPYCKQAWTDEEIDNKISNLKSKIEKNTDEIHDLVETSGSYQGDIISLEEKVKELEKVIGDTTEGEIIRFDGKLESAEKSIETLEKKLDRLKVKLSELNELDESDTSSIEADIISLREELEDAQVDLKSKQSEYEAAASGSDFKNEQEVLNKFNKLERSIERFNEAKASENPYKGLVADKKKDLKKAENPDDIREDLEELTKQSKHLTYMVKLLTDSKSFLRKSFINKYVPYLNKKINEYAQTLGSPHTCFISPDLTVELEYLKQPVSYHMMSSGEMLRIDMAVCFALRDLMSSLGVKNDFLMIDEVFDSSLDTSGMQKIFKTVTDRFSKVMLISHTGKLDDKCDSVITVQKSNAFSSLIVS